LKIPLEVRTSTEISANPKGILQGDFILNFEYDSVQPISKISINCDGKWDQEDKSYSILTLLQTHRFYYQQNILNQLETFQLFQKIL
jgi:hypothetical protein